MLSSRKRKVEIESDLEKDPNDPRYKLISPVTKKSSVWTNFQQIEFNGKPENFARCTKCTELLSCSSKTGTGSLLRHKCSNRSEQLTNACTPPPGIRIQKLPTQQIHVPMCQSSKWLTCSKIVLAKEEVNFIVQDLRPLNTLEGKAFQNFCQHLIYIGAQYGRQHVQNILTSKITIEKEVIPEDYNRSKNELKIDLSKYHLAFTIDTWTGEHTKRSFLTLTVHYFKEYFNLRARVVGTCELTADSNIHDSVLEIFSRFNLDKDKLKTGVIVTDNNPDVKAAFQNYKHLSCACQNLNLAIEEALEKSYISKLKILIDDSRKLLQFFMNSELNSQLTKPLKGTVGMSNMRWNSIYTMLTDILDEYVQIQRLLVTTKEVHKITTINPNLLRELLDFLGPFKECSEQFSSEAIPTIHQYVLWFEKLIKHCTKNSGDSETISELKVCTANALEKFLQPSPLHTVAIFLNPPYKKLKFMTLDKRANTMATVKTMLEALVQPKNNEIKKEMVDINPVDSSGQSSSSAEPVACSTSDTIDLFDEFKDEYDEDENNISIKEVDAELETYLKKKVNHCNILDFWREATELPLLRSLAKQILKIPVSAANGERIFSASASTLAERRTHLNEKLDEILFLNKSY